jgi:uncharacterized RDD family membrane protein YckC
LHRTARTTSGGTVYIGTETTRKIVPATRLDVEPTDLDTIVFFTAFISFALVEWSRHQSGLGKLALGFHAADTAGERLTFPRTLIRNVAKLLSMPPLLLSYIMAGWAERKQVLHDMNAKAVVRVY